MRITRWLHFNSVIFFAAVESGLDLKYIYYVIQYTKTSNIQRYYCCDLDFERQYNEIYDGDGTFPVGGNDSQTNYDLQTHRHFFCYSDAWDNRCRIFV